MSYKKEAWEFVVKMMCIMKDLYNGNPNLPKGCEEEAVGHNAIAETASGLWRQHLISSERLILLKRS